MKLYLSMCAWLHDSNPKAEVNNARALISKVLQLVKLLFPRDGFGNGWNIPKFHAATKFPDYISRYGSATTLTSSVVLVNQLTSSLLRLQVTKHNEDQVSLHTRLLNSITIC